eukprot:TRINITY_DN3748_c4_g1_i1.p1 TRINITY_DN3748_c4_g1~~TRINITY_DN3748_c4_g1_i1.p1  ORF type:complete len:604 (+),score=144.27 TRINITY_DN3748_c4_g1_i1:75-1886(+)
MTASTGARRQLALSWQEGGPQPSPDCSWSDNSQQPPPQCCRGSCGAPPPDGSPLVSVGHNGGSLPSPIVQQHNGHYPPPPPQQQLQQQQQAPPQQHYQLQHCAPPPQQLQPGAPLQQQWVHHQQSPVQHVYSMHGESTGGSPSYSTRALAPANFSSPVRGCSGSVRSSSSPPHLMMHSNGHSPPHHHTGAGDEHCSSPGVPYSVAALVDSPESRSGAGPDNSQAPVLTAFVEHLGGRGGRGPCAGSHSGKSSSSPEQPPPMRSTPDLPQQAAEADVLHPLCVPPSLAVHIDGAPELADACGEYRQLEHTVNNMPIWKFTSQRGVEWSLYSNDQAQWCIGRPRLLPEVQSCQRHLWVQMPNFMPQWRCAQYPAAQVSVVSLTGAISQRQQDEWPVQPAPRSAPGEMWVQHAPPQQPPPQHQWMQQQPPPPPPQQHPPPPPQQQQQQQQPGMPHETFCAIGGLNHEAVPFIPAQGPAPPGDGVHNMQVTTMPQHAPRDTLVYTTAPAGMHAQQNAPPPPAPMRRREVRAPPSGAPPNWCTQLCRSVEQATSCSFGDRCHFAHSREELRPRQGPGAGGGNRPRQANWRMNPGQQVVRESQNSAPRR